jgi:hypothetical protein
MTLIYFSSFGGGSCSFHEVASPIKRPKKTFHISMLNSVLLVRFHPISSHSRCFMEVALAPSENFSRLRDAEAPDFDLCSERQHSFP